MSKSLTSFRPDLEIATLAKIAEANSVFDANDNVTRLKEKTEVVMRMLQNLTKAQIDQVLEEAIDSGKRISEIVDVFKAKFLKTTRASLANTQLAKQPSKTKDKPRKTSLPKPEFTHAIDTCSPDFRPIQLNLRTAKLLGAQGKNGVKIINGGIIHNAIQGRKTPAHKVSGGTSTRPSRRQEKRV